MRKRRPRSVLCAGGCGYVYQLDLVLPAVHADARVADLPVQPSGLLDGDRATRCIEMAFELTMDLDGLRHDPADHVA